MDTDVTNAKRAAWADAALYLFRELTGSDQEDALGDLLCDLMHWAGQNAFDFDLALSRAKGHFEEELAEERRLPTENPPDAAARLSDVVDDLLELLAGLEGISDTLDAEVLGSREYRKACVAVANAKRALGTIEQAMGGAA